METYEIDLIKLKASFWDALLLKDAEMDSTDEDVLALLTVQNETIDAIKTQGTLKK